MSIYGLTSSIPSSLCVSSLILLFLQDLRNKLLVPLSSLVSSVITAEEIAERIELDQVLEMV